MTLYTYNAMHVPYIVIYIYTYIYNFTSTIVSNLYISIVSYNLPNNLAESFNKYIGTKVSPNI